MFVLLSFMLCLYWAAGSLFTVDVQQQQQERLMVDKTGVDLIYELKKAEIIPTVLDVFTPLVTVNATWKDATADYGNTLAPHKTKNQPDITLTTIHEDLFAGKKGPQLTLAVTDPDAPSRDNPEWSEICHWIVTDLPAEVGSSITPAPDANRDMSSLGKRMMDVMPYKPPGPPPKTGKHRYVFVALVPKNGTTDKLHLRKPDDRQHWGYDNERQGLRKWAKEMGLAVVGANFIYEQNEKQ